MNKTIGILAHVDAGKTTFSEQLLYHAGSIRSRGRVDHRDAFLDSHPLERERGITVFADEGTFDYRGNSYTLLDTPGHVDFSAEMERAVHAMDYAVLLVSAAEGVQGHTETVWNLLAQRKLPVFFFLNKTDRAGADPAQVLADIRQKFSGSAVDFSDGYRDGKLTEKLAEAVAELDETLLEEYIEHGVNESLWQDTMIRLIQERRLFPCFSGSALLDEGISTFLEVFDNLTRTYYDETLPFAAQVYKIRRDGQNRLAYLKVTQGTLKVKDLVPVWDEAAGEAVRQKVNEIRMYSGTRFTPISSVRAGMVCAVTGLSLARCGSAVGTGFGHTAYEIIPMLTAQVLFDEKITDPKTVLGDFRELEDEDPMLRVVWEEGLHRLQVHVMGTVQLEVLEQVVKQRFGLSVQFGDCEILYQETVANAVTGRGHFEPLRHYAEVHLRLEPGVRGSGVVFATSCSQDILDSNFQNLVRTHVLEREHHGVLLGAPLTDVKVTLLTGRAHIKHTEGGDFREAVYRAIRQGLEKADSLILEPFYRFRIEVDEEQVGRVLSDVQKYAGNFDPPQSASGRICLTGCAPAATFLNYGREFVTFTRGHGSLSIQFGGYTACHNPQEVLEQRAYDRRRDPGHTSDSVFCSHGSGFVVPWDEADSYMHCESAD